MQIASLLLVLLIVEGYYLHGYLFFKDDFCGSFARLDDEIGWTLKPSTTRCIKSRGNGSGPNRFSSRVHINADGARAADVSSPTPTQSLLAIGDSWTFGYGIDWRETFAGQLTRSHGRPTALLASPAYSGAQALLLARRHVASLRPSNIIYLELGFLERAFCTGATRPTTILKPCYWVDGAGAVHLVKPRSGYVRRMSNLGLRPGGMVGAGEKTPAYFLVARPIAKIKQMLVRLGVLSGFGNDFAAWGPAEEFEKIRAAHLKQLMSLAKEAGARLLLIDPGEVYKPYTMAHGEQQHLIYVGTSEWNAFVAGPMAKLPAAQALVPGDGHFGPGTHRLIAALIHRTLLDTN